ncbi:hypothetical protein MBLNU13_g08511t1 [Cladosporium sp. NU13]
MLSNPTKALSALPSLPTLSAFLLSHFAQLSPLAAAAEVPWLYHSPLPPRPKPKSTTPGVQAQLQPPRPLPAHSGVRELVLSITPTEGVYAALGASPLPPPLDHSSGDGFTDPAPAIATVPQRFKPPPGGREKFTTAAFLHRPWSLTRGRLPHGTTVWTSHKAFDESLTTGYNLALLESLGANVKDPNVLVGYKGDEGRRIGVVAGFGETGKDELEMDDIKGRIIAQFGDLQGEGEWFGFDGPAQKTINNGSAPTAEQVRNASKITSIACMNAFHPAEVDRVAAVGFEAGLVTSLEDCSSLLYLTGAVREEGLAAALQKEKVREKWPEVDVQVIDEEEVKPLPKQKKEVKPHDNKKTKNVPKPKPKQQEHNGVRANEVTPLPKRRRTESEDKGYEGGVMLSDRCFLKANERSHPLHWNCAVPQRPSALHYFNEKPSTVTWSMDSDNESMIVNASGLRTPSPKRVLEQENDDADKRPAKRPRKANVVTSYNYDDMITVLVGPEETKFTAHKDEKVIALPEVEEETFQTYMDFVFGLPIFDGETEPLPLVKFYVLGDFLDDVKARDKALRLVIAERFCPNPETVGFIWDHTTSNSLLRQAAYDGVAARLGVIEFAKKVKQYPAEFVQQFAEKMYFHLPAVFPYPSARLQAFLEGER